MESRVDCRQPLPWDYFLLARDSETNSKSVLHSWFS
jgi:hypothetical protein